jgi:hypothetical protein
MLLARFPFFVRIQVKNSVNKYKKYYIIYTDKNNTYGCRLGRFHPFIGHEGP